MDEVSERVKKIIAEQLALDSGRVADDASFKDDLRADSLDMVELTMALEEEFDCEITDEEVEHVSTVGQAVALIEGKVTEEASED